MGSDRGLVASGMRVNAAELAALREPASIGRAVR
jgi:hypothetical protein